MPNVFDFLGRTATGIGRLGGQLIGGAGGLIGGVGEHIGTGLRLVRDEERARLQLGIEKLKDKQLLNQIIKDVKALPYGSPERAEKIQEYQMRLGLSLQPTKTADVFSNLQALSKIPAGFLTPEVEEALTSRYANELLKSQGLEQYERVPAIPEVPETPAQKRELWGIDWLVPDIPAKPAIPGQAAKMGVRPTTTKEAPPPEAVTDETAPTIKEQRPAIPKHLLDRQNVRKWLIRFGRTPEGRGHTMLPTVLMRTHPRTMEELKEQSWSAIKKILSLIKEGATDEEIMG